MGKPVAHADVVGQQISLSLAIGGSCLGKVGDGVPTLSGGSQVAHA